MKLFHSQFTRSHRARWALEEVGAAHEVNRLALSKGESKTPEYLAIHPHGAVPALVDGDLKLIESSAIAMHLADKFPEKKLAPPLGSDERAEYYRWMVYIPATVDPILEMITLHTRLLPEDKRIPALAEHGLARFGKVAKVIEDALEGKTYIVGKTFTAADIIVGSAVGWMGFLGKLGDHPKLAAYLENVQARPAFKASHAD